MPGSETDGGVPSGRVPPKPRGRVIPIACLLLAALLAARANAADRRLRDFPACPAVTSTTSIYVDRGIGASTAEAATPAQVCQAGATTTPAAGVVPKADGSGLLPVGFLPAATTATLGAVILATPSSDTTAGHAVQASDARLSDARAPTTHGASSHSGNVFPLDAGQVLGLGYIDFTGQAASGVGNPSGGAKRRLIFDTTTGELAVKSITGTVFGLEHAAWAPGASTTLAAHCVLIGNGGSAPALACPSTAGQVLTSNGASSDPSFQTVGTTSPTMTNATINQAANGDAAITSTRATDTSPTGSFSLFKSAAGATLWRVDITGSLAAGTVPVARVTGLAASATTDTTNGANISSGTVGVARGGTGAGTLAAHGVMVGNGTSAVAVTGTGTAGQVLTSNGASADPTWQTSAMIGANKTSSQSVTSSTTLVNDTALILTLSPGQTYSVDIFLGVTASLAGGFKWDYSLGDISILHELWQWEFVDQDGSSSGGITLVGGITGFTEGRLHIRGTIETSGSTGTITLVWAQATSDATATTVLRDSRIQAQKL